MTYEQYELPPGVEPASTKTVTITLIDAMRAIADLTKRVNKLEAAEEARQKVRHYPPPKGLRSDKERPGVSLGVSTSLGPYAPFDDDGA